MTFLLLLLLLVLQKKKHRENFCNTGKTQGKHREFHVGKNVATLEAESLLEEAEEKENLLALSKARALRAKAKSVKSKDLPAVDQSLVDLEKELQSMID